MTSNADQPAPGHLANVQALVNTLDIDAGSDAIGTPALLGRWLLAQGLTESKLRISTQEWERVVKLREALRVLALRNSGAAPDEAETTRLNELSEMVALRPRFNSHGLASLTPTQGGVHGAIAAILGDVYAAMIDGTWSRMKVCRNDECRWLFYDRSRNQSAVWCSMAECGDKFKARAYRRRQRG